VQRLKNSQGQSLVEVLVAVGAMSLLLVALLALVSLSIRNSRLAKDRAQAVALAQEGVELMRAYRDYSWTEFSSIVQAEEYDLPYIWTVEMGLSDVCIKTPTINDLFYRCVRVDMLVANEAEVEVRVAWMEGSQLQETTQLTKLSLWER
jgi:hypothetical protein